MKDTGFGGQGRGDDGKKIKPAQTDRIPVAMQEPVLIERSPNSDEVCEALHPLREDPEAKPRMTSQLLPSF